MPDNSSLITNNGRGKGFKQAHRCAGDRAGSQKADSIGGQQFPRCAHIGVCFLTSAIKRRLCRMVKNFGDNIFGNRHGINVVGMNKTDLSRRKIRQIKAVITVAFQNAESQLCHGVQCFLIHFAGRGNIDFSIGRWHGGNRFIRKCRRQ